MAAAGRAQGPARAAPGISDSLVGYIDLVWCSVIVVFHIPPSFPLGLILMQLASTIVLRKRPCTVVITDKQKFDASFL